MATSNKTPCTVFFDTWKKHAGMSYKETASLILSTKSQPGTMSPASRAEDRTWLSRYIVHAPVDAIHEGYFAPFDSSALKVIARIKSSKRSSLASSEAILGLLCGPAGEEMMAALRPYNDDAATYGNMLVRLKAEKTFTVNERTEIAMVLFLAAACTASVEKAVDAAIKFAKFIHGSDVGTPLITPDSQTAMQETRREKVEEAAVLGLVRVVDGYVMGAPHWLDDGKGESAARDTDSEDGSRSDGDNGEVPITVIGSLATGARSISDVAPDVSAMHLLIWPESGHWYVQDCESKGGSALVDGATHEARVLAPPKKERPADFEFPTMEVRPGDELVLGADTRFIVIAGVPG